MIFAYKIFISIVSLVIFIYLAQSIVRIRQDKKSLLYFMAASGAASCIPIMLDDIIGMDFKALTALLILIIMSKAFLGVSLLTSVVCSVLFSLILAVGDIITVLVMVRYYGYTFETIKSNILLSFTSDLILYGTAIIIIFIIRLVSKSKELSNTYRHKTQFRISLYMLLTFTVVAVNYSIYIEYMEIMDGKAVIINVAVMWIYLILSLYIGFTNSALSLKEQQYEQQQDYIKTIDSLVYEFRRLKHSYTNNIYSIYGYIHEDDMEGLKSYFSEIMDEAKKMDNNILLALQKIKVYAIFGLLWSKIIEAQSLNINVGVRVSGEIYETGMRLTDICEILGNYIDNAIEAAACAENKSMNISFIDDETFLTIDIENTFSGDADPQKIYQEGYSSKGKDRGHGLTIVKKILNSYNNVLNNTIVENGVFRQELVIKK